MSKILFVDMDGVIADFGRGVGRPHDRHEGGLWWDDPKEMFEKGFFRNLHPLSWAKEAIYRLENEFHLDIHVATKPVLNEHCASEKLEWIKHHFPTLYKKTHIIQNKGLLLGDYLVDDDLRWEKKFKGTFFHFNTLEPLKSWDMVFDHLHASGLRRV